MKYILIAISIGAFIYVNEQTYQDELNTQTFSEVQYSKNL